MAIVSRPAQRVNLSVLEELPVLRLRINKMLMINIDKP
jgi:hypothetical protein